MKASSKNLYDRIAEQAKTMAGAHTPPPGFDVAQAVHSLRKARELSGAELCRRAGDLDPRTLTALEKGRIRNPSIKTFESLARGLGVPLAVLFREKQGADPSGVISGSQKGAFTMEFGRGIKLISFTPLIPDFFCGKLILGSKTKITESFLKHAAPIYVSMLIGRLEVKVEEKIWMLREGENILLNGVMKHSFYNPAQREASFLLLTAPSFLKR